MTSACPCFLPFSWKEAISSRKSGESGSPTQGTGPADSTGAWRGRQPFSWHSWMAEAARASLPFLSLASPRRLPPRVTLRTQQGRLSVTGPRVSVASLCGLSGRALSCFSWPRGAGGPVVWSRCVCMQTQCLVPPLWLGWGSAISAFPVVTISSLFWPETPTCPTFPWTRSCPRALLAPTGPPPRGRHMGPRCPLVPEAVSAALRCPVFCRLLFVLPLALGRSLRSAAALRGLAGPAEGKVGA